MDTIEDVARSVLAALGSDANILNASVWAADRYQQLCSRARFRHLRQIGELPISGSITGGAITVTRGSNIVLGDVTAQAAWSNALEGRWLRVRITWYEIVRWLGTSLQLAVPFAEDDQVATTTYVIVPRFLSLDPDTRWIGDMVHMRRRQPLQRKSNFELDHTAPARQHVSQAGPTMFTEAPTNADGTKRIEVYPYSLKQEVVHYVYWTKPPRLAIHDLLPPAVDPYILREGVLIDAMRYEMAKTLRGTETGQGYFSRIATTAEVWRNDYRAQTIIWERCILDAIRNDRGSDDTTFILQKATAQPQGDIVTARDMIVDRWPR